MTRNLCNRREGFEISARNSLLNVNIQLLGQNITLKSSRSILSVPLVTCFRNDKWETIRT